MHACMYLHFTSQVDAVYACIKHGDELMHHLRGRYNVAYKCSCLNGIGSSGVNCPQNGGKKCDSCNAGWRASPDHTQCLANQCSCENGKHVTGATCATHGSNTCESCNPGFKLNSTTLSCIGTMFLCISIYDAYIYVRMYLYI